MFQWLSLTHSIKFNLDNLPNNLLIWNKICTFFSYNQIGEQCCWPSTKTEKDASHIEMYNVYLNEKNNTMWWGGSLNVNKRVWTLIYKLILSHMSFYTCFDWYKIEVKILFQISRLFRKLSRLNLILWIKESHWNIL
jgi:hypothetical protein